MYGGRPYPVDFHTVNTTVNRIIFENEALEIWSIPLKHRVPSVGYLFREKSPGLNIRKEMITRYSISIEEIVSIKKGADLIRNNAVIPNSRLTYMPYVPRSYAYCTDTTYSPEIAEQVKHVDLLYHEASFASADAELAKLNGHSTATEAANIARLAEAKQLLIGHFSMRYKHPSQLVKEAQSIFPATEEAIEGKTYDIETRL